MKPYHLKLCHPSYYFPLSRGILRSCPWLVFAPGHAGPREKSPHRTALRGEAGDLFFFTPPRAPPGAPHFRGPVFEVSGAPIMLPPAKSSFRGPAIASEFRAENVNFRRMLRA